MSNENFAAGLAHVLRHEGGYVDHPADPGGATNFGITHRVLAEWRGHPVSREDVRNLRVEEAGEIYRARYWAAVRGDDLPAGLDLAMFDFAVNSGPSRAIRFLQAVLDVHEDGRLGPATMAAIALRTPSSLIDALIERRRIFLQRLPTYPVFGRGWSRRLESVERHALRLARNAMPSTRSVQPPKETTMDMTKSILSSRTIWANLIGLGAILLTLFGFNTAGLDPTVLADKMLEVIAGISFVASTLFRVVATKKIA